MVVDLLAQGIEVPPLSSRQIAAEADAVLAEYAKRFGPITKPPIEIEDVATSVLPLTFGFSDLQSQLGGRVHGAIWFSRQHILIDDALNPDRFPDLLGRYHFTLAHEIAHWQLHRFLFLDEHGRAVLYGDGEMPDVICRKDHARPLIERQADEFAGCLLMPEWLLRPAWRSLTGGDEPICNRQLQELVPAVEPIRFLIDADGIEVEPDPIRLMREVFCESLAHQFAVSDEAMRIQLEYLDLFAE